jgi:hypothetical protein
MLPGQHVPKNIIGIMEDNGHFLRTAQIFFNEAGKEIRRYVWDSECDGNPSPVIGVDPPGSATLGCRGIACVFRLMPATDSAACRPPIPRDAGRGFRGMPAPSVEVIPSRG